MKLRKQRLRQQLKCRNAFPFMTTGVWRWKGRRHNEYADKPGASEKVTWLRLKKLVPR